MPFAPSKTGPGVVVKVKYLKRVVLLSIFALLGAVGFSQWPQALASPKLQVEFGGNGIQRLSYAGQTLEDLDTYPSDEFHVWHMKAVDALGQTVAGREYEWGEVNSGRAWDTGTRTWTYQFKWGVISVQFITHGDTLDIKVVTTNRADSGITFCGATIYPFTLHFPALPYGFTPSYASFQYNTNGPSVTQADFASGQVVSAVADPEKPLYSGFSPAAAPNSYVPIVSSTAPDNLASFLPHNDRPLKPGQTDSFTVSLRFAPSGTPLSELAKDVYQNWERKWPFQLSWPDRRIIGTVFLASSRNGNSSEPGGYPSNPRRYFNDPKVNVQTPEGLRAFQERILRQAAENAQNLKRLNAQGVITWDLEGEEYPHPTSYLGAADEIGRIAPELESIVPDSFSKQAGMKLVDAYFQIMREEGFRIGLCVRPQHFVVNSDRTAQQAFLPDSQIISELSRKIDYARRRWNASLFYVDSNVETHGAVLDVSIIRELARRFSTCLIIPEQSTPIYYAYSAPFKTFLSHTDLGTAKEVYNYYPTAFSVNLINDANPAQLAKYRNELTEAARRGDILMVHADYWQENNNTVAEIFRSAHESWLNFGLLKRVIHFQ